MAKAHRKKKTSWTKKATLFPFSYFSDGNNVILKKKKKRYKLAET